MVAQACSQQYAHSAGMHRDPSTPADRIRWAVRQSGRTLEDIAEAMECSHSALSLWQTGRTNVHNIKAGLLVAFSRETGVSIDWLLTGDGPRLTGYGRQRDEAPLVATARHIVTEMPEQMDVAQRLLAALEPPPKKYVP